MKQTAVRADLFRAGPVRHSGKVSIVDRGTARGAVPPGNRRPAPYPIRERGQDIRVLPPRPEGTVEIARFPKGPFIRT